MSTSETTNNSSQSFANTLSVVMAARQVSRQDLATQSGVSYKSICDYINGLKLPRITQHERICAALNIHMSEFHQVLEQLQDGGSVTIPARH